MPAPLRTRRASPEGSTQRRTSSRSQPTQAQTQTQRRGRRSTQVVDDDEEEEEEEAADDDGEEVEEEEEEDTGPSRRKSHGGATYGGRKQTQQIGGGGGGGRRKRGRAADDDDDDEELGEIEIEGDATRTQTFKALTQAILISDDEEDDEEAKRLEKERDDHKWQTWIETCKIDHPVDAEYAAKLTKQSVKEAATFLGEIEHAAQVLTDAIVALEEYRLDLDGEQEEGEHPRFKQINKDVKELLDAGHLANGRMRILENMQQDIENDNIEGMDLMQKYTQASENLQVSYSQKTQRQRYGKSKPYENFRILAWDAARRNEEKPMPPVVEMLPKEAGDGDGDDDEDDLQIGGVTTNFKDPLTQALLEDPVKHTVCSHVYSRKTIREYVATERRAKGSAICPASGCDARIEPKNLIEDDFMAKRVEFFKRRQARAELAGGNGATGARRRQQAQAELID